MIGPDQPRARAAQPAAGAAARRRPHRDGDRSSGCAAARSRRRVYMRYTAVGLALFALLLYLGLRNDLFGGSGLILGLAAPHHARRRRPRATAKPRPRATTGRDRRARGSRRRTRRSRRRAACGSRPPNRPFGAASTPQSDGRARAARRRPSTSETGAVADREAPPAERRAARTARARARVECGPLHDAKRAGAATAPSDARGQTPDVPRPTRLFQPRPRSDPLGALRLGAWPANAR